MQGDLNDDSATIFVPVKLADWTSNWTSQRNMGPANQKLPTRYLQNHIYSRPFLLNAQVPNLYSKCKKHPGSDAADPVNQLAVNFLHEVLSPHSRFISHLFFHEPPVCARRNKRTRQDKKITSFQPAWLIRCSTPHQGQPSAIFSCLHLRTWQTAKEFGCHMHCCIV